MIAESRPVIAVVPAAGAARRFGSAKLLADVGGQPLLARTLRSLLDGGVDRVVVVVPPDHGFGAVTLLVDARVTTVVNPEPARGMFSSVQVGLRLAGEGGAQVVLPADMPFVLPETVALVVAEQDRGGGSVVAAHGGKTGHPVALDRQIRQPLCDLPPDTTLKAALARVGVTLRRVEVDDPGVLRDVDVPGDLERWPGRSNRRVGETS